MNVFIFLVALLLILGLCLPTCANANPLNGRKILIDPGHGGEEGGAIGLLGLKECDVNLAIAKKLVAMLREEGADALLTRESDQTLSISARLDLCKQTTAEIFVSIHHNANAENNRSQNRSEAYYHWKDRFGPSHDLAKEILTELDRSWGLPQSRTYITYAYGILRTNPTTAVLAEASYMCCPEAERQLREDSHLTEEASAYFRAIKRFCEKGKLKIDWATPLESEASDTPSFSAQVITEWGPGVDADTVEVLLDNSSLPHFFDVESGLITAMAASPISGGTHTIEFRAVNLAGNFARPLLGEFHVQSQPARLTLEISPQGKSKSPRNAEVKVLDRNGFLIPDDITVSLFMEGAQLVENKDWLRTSAESKTSVDLVCRSGQLEFAVVPQTNARTASLKATVGQCVIEKNWEWDDSPSFALLVTDASGQAIPNASILESGRLIRLSDSLGIVSWIAESKDTFPNPKNIEVNAPGFFTSSAITLSPNNEGLARVALKPLFGGLLNGKSFILDPQHGGEDTGVVGSNRLRASDVNLQTANRLAAHLRISGATVSLTRTWDNTMDDEARVRYGLEHEVDHFLCIDHLAYQPGLEDPPDLNETQVFFKWNTDEKQLMTECLRDELVESLETPKGEIRPMSIWQGLHAQRSYRVLQVSPLLMTAPGVPERLLHSAAIDKEALGVLYGFVAIHRAWAEKAGRTLPDLSGILVGKIIDATTNKPIDKAVVTLDGGLSVQTESDGMFRFKYLESGVFEGSYRITVRAEGYRTNKIDLTAKPEAIVHSITMQQ